MYHNSRLEEKVQPKEQESVSQHVDGDETRFSSREKWCIVVFVSFVGLFRCVPTLYIQITYTLTKCVRSPLTANIYFPAIPTLSEAFKKSTEMINLTVCLICPPALLCLSWQVTMYMVLQGVGTYQCLQVVP